MKRFLSILLLLAFSLAAKAQSAEEILARMEKVFDRPENSGVKMTVVTRVPVLGSMTMIVYTLDHYARIDTRLLGNYLIAWDDGETEWTYKYKGNEIEIDSSSGPSDESGDTALFKGVAEGYDVSIKKETDEAWYIQGKKSSTNPETEAPKAIEIVVAKGTYHPISLSTKIKGVTLTMQDLSFDVRKEQVVFDIKDFPTAKIVDKRQK